MRQEQERQVSRVTHITTSEGGNWIPVDRWNSYRVVIGKTINKEVMQAQLGTKTIAAFKTESGHIYDFILGDWRHLYEKTTVKEEDRFIRARLEDTMMPDPATICREEATAIEKILAERGSRYGSFSGHALITQNLKAAMKDSPNWPTLTDSQKETLEMVAHKIGRILNGDPNYLDSWVDIVGYTQLVVDQLNGKDT